MAAPGSFPSSRVGLLLGRRAVAYFRTGDLETAKRLAAELNARFPFDTWRGRYPDDPDSETERNRYRSIQEALKAAGNRDHPDPDADFGVTPVDVLHENFEGESPTTAPGVTTVNTEQLASMLETHKPLVIDTMDASWYRSVPGAVGLDFNGNTHGTFTDEVQKRLEPKLRALTGGRHGEADRCGGLQRCALRRLQSRAPLAPRWLYQCLLVSRRPRSMGGGRQAGGRGAAGRLVIGAKGTSGEAR